MKGSTDREEKKDDTDAKGNDKRVDKQ